MDLMRVAVAYLRAAILAIITVTMGILLMALTVVQISIVNVVTALRAVFMGGLFTVPTAAVAAAAVPALGRCTAAEHHDRDGHYHHHPKIH